MLIALPSVAHSAATAAAGQDCILRLDTSAAVPLQFSCACTCMHHDRLDLRYMSRDLQGCTDLQSLVKCLEPVEIKVAVPQYGTCMTHAYAHTQPSSADHCILRDVYLRAGLSRKLSIFADNNESVNACMSKFLSRMQSDVQLCSAEATQAPCIGFVR